MRFEQHGPARLAAQLDRRGQVVERQQAEPHGERRAILARLAGGEASVSELAEPFDISLPAISKHLKVLERAGLISRGRDAQFRPCRLEPRPLKAVSDWLEPYRSFWEQSLDHLENYLKELQGKEKKRGRRH